MKFIISNYSSTRHETGVYLVPDNWNDFGYITSFAMYYKEKKMEEKLIGIVKIGEFDLGELDSSPNIQEKVFEELGENQFSLGQSTDYYKNIKELGDDIREDILNSLNDLAINPKLFEKALLEDVTQKSLMRDINLQSVKDQYARISRGGSILTDYDFEYKIPSLEDKRNTLNFQVYPNSLPPTNLHALIGTNGVGKTQTLNSMLKSLINKNTKNNYSNEIEEIDDILFSNMIFVSFSAFDKSDLNFLKESAMSVSYIGLRKIGKENESKTFQDLVEEFCASVHIILRSRKGRKFKNIISFLNYDYNLENYGIADILNQLEIEVKSDADKEVVAEKLGPIFEKMSSGHKIVLLTVARLVELVSEKTLVVFDEPEAHLHPPLLSAFISSISELLILENGVGIMATHSPVILQEIPKSCVSIIRRNGEVIIIDTPRFETFGEDVGVLTDEIFGLEIMHTGFHSLLKKVIKEDPDYEVVLEKFNNQLGLEARTLARAYIEEELGRE